jgi:predicted RNA binding protein YcfA (HicA-like mRNA interferase family)
MSKLPKLSGKEIVKILVENSDSKSLGKKVHMLF